MTRDKRQRTPSTRIVTFVTGARAEFGLMRTVLHAIQKHRALNLQIIATGMHLDPAHGDPLKTIAQDGWNIDRIIPWEPNSGRAAATNARVINARNTGLAMAALADAFAQLNTDIVLVVGDRVEAFAAASAAHLAGIPLAHVHGGDRAAGQVDDSLRHAITKLAHIHFPATRQSAKRILQLGEDRWRIIPAGSPGLDGITKAASNRRAIEAKTGRLTRNRFALIVLHPIEADDATEYHRARAVLNAVAATGFEQVVIIYPNNDPGAAGIMRCWESIDSNPAGRFRVHRDLPRSIFLGLLRDCAVLVGNSSSGIIEAASFGTPVLDVGPRQLGRQRGPNVINVPYARSRIATALRRIWNNGAPKRFASENIYGAGGAGRIIASSLAQLRVDDRLLRKLIRY